METFKKVQAENKAAAAKHIDNYASSSEDEGELDEKQILDLLYKHYNSQENANTSRTSAYLENTLHSGAATCLICIGSIRRVESIWSCKNCYCFFHLNCIKRWSNDSLMQKKVKAQQQNGDQGHYNNLGEFVPPKRVGALHWCCPQCRKDYLPADRPKQYECFCGKEIDPQPQPFLVPHSCGEICGKLLPCQNGHDCKLLCHPGPCPPCAQVVHKSCLCGKSASRSVRCIDKHWKCEQLCSSLLPCGKHKCNQRCHQAGQCPSCTMKSSQPCECGRETKIVNCSQLKWKCPNICGLSYSCGLHKCDKICHSGPCGECPLGLPRSCPCGKSLKSGPCNQIVEPCGDTCQKLLPCGIHTCAQRCHRGPCNLCPIITNKKCRCGMHQKELPCSKEFTCETKCRQTRDCGKHACNRKCCGDQCPPCEKICGKQLSCNKHRCQSVCHNGPCYPCKLESQVNCRCGKTRKSVPCGRERKARIVCMELCRISSKCHHPVKHRCHKSECPACVQVCGLPNDVSGCGHICKVRCHAAIPHLNKSNTNKTKYDYKSQPHPRCEEGVTVTCIGGHEVAVWPCWNSKPSSCQRKCARKLKCGNPEHVCQLICHPVADLTNMQEQSGCAPCDAGCTRARPAGCLHPCTKGCHPLPCAACNVILSLRCHCGLNKILSKCSEFFEAGNEDEVAIRQEKIRNCGNRCSKNFACGHRCMSVCHSGQCPSPELCRKKVRIFCKCLRIKAEIACDKHRAGQTSLCCDNDCAIEQSRVKEAEKQQLAQKLLNEEEKNRLELEKFEQKFGKRKQRIRKTIDVEKPKADINWHRILLYLLATLAVGIAIGVAFYADS